MRFDFWDAVIIMLIIATGLILMLLYQDFMAFLTKIMETVFFSLFVGYVIGRILRRG